MELYTYDVNPRPSFRAIRSGKTFWEQFAPSTTQEFRNKFGIGVNAYLDGDWPKATAVLRGEGWPSRSD